MRGGEPDPACAADQAELRRLLRELMTWAGHGSLYRLQVAATRRGVHLPVSTADRALNADRLPTADFVRRFVLACGVDPRPWVTAREAIADRGYARVPAAGADPRTDPGAPCPYPGLAAFGPERARWFFGREAVVAELVGQLAARLDGGPPLVVTAPSGAGKSSVLLAGLVPAVRAGALPGSGSWPVHVCTPTEHPLDALTEAVGAPAAGSAAGPVPRLLVVDQFEETFTLCQDERVRARFVDRLCAMAAGGTLVVLGVRADGYGRCAGYPSLVRSIRAGHVLLGAMGADELRDAITRPATAVGLRLEPGLVEVMLADLGVREGEGAGYDPGALPLLSHALLATWQRSRGGTLTLDGYRSAGGIRGAIATTAERVHRGLDESGRAAARLLLLGLVVVGEDGADARRRQLLSGLPEGVVPVLAELAAARLVTVGETTVELAHEALLRSWPRLRGWIDDDRAGLLARQRLADAAEVWDREGRHPSGLYRGPRLAAAQEWVGDGDGLPPLSLRFLTESAELAAAEHARRRRAERRLRRLLAGTVTALVVALVATALAVVQARRADVAGLRADARRLGEQALSERDPRRAMRLATAAVALDDSPRTSGNLLSTLLRSPYLVAAAGVQDGDRLQSMALSADGATVATTSYAGRVQLYETDGLRHVRTLSHSAMWPVTGAGFAGDGRLVAWGVGRPAGSPEGGIMVWDTVTARVVGGPFGPARVLAGRVVGGSAVVLDTTGAVTEWDLTTRRLRHTHVATGALYLAGGADGRHVVVDVGDGALLLDPVTGAVRRLDGVLGARTLGPDGRLLLAGTRGTDIEVWDVSAGVRVGVARRHTAEVLDAVWSADGRSFATGADDRLAVVWDAATLVPRRVLTGHAGRVQTQTFTQDGATLLTAGLDGSVLAWDLAGTRGLHREVHPPRGFTAEGQRYLDAVAHPDGDRLLVADTERLRVLDAATGAETATLLPFTDANDYELSGDGRLLVLCHRDGTAQVFDAATGAAVTPRLATGDGDGATAAAISHDGALVAVATARVDHGTGRVHLFDTGSGAALGPPLTSAAELHELNLSRDGRYLVGGSFDGRVFAWDLGRRAQVAEVRVQDDRYPVWTSEFSPDGRHLAVGGELGRASVLRVGSWERAWQATTGHNGYDTALSFSPDGRVLASSGTDSKTFLYDVDTGELLGSPFGPEANVWTYGRYLAGGTTMVSVGDDGSVTHWDLDPRSWLRRACAVAGGGLTEDEWAQLVPGRPYRRPCR